MLQFHRNITQYDISHGTVAVGGVIYRDVEAVQDMRDQEMHTHFVNVSASTIFHNIGIESMQGAWPYACV